MKKIMIILLLVLTITMIPYNSKAAEQGTGLEVESPKLPVHIVQLAKSTKEFGLSKQLIRSKVELSLRQNDIEVLNESSVLYPYGLFVEITFIGDEYSGGGFDINLHFKRIIEYSSGETNYKKVGSSYTQGTTGTSSDTEFIINSLEDQIDIFINEFYRANNF